MNFVQTENSELRAKWVVLGVLSVISYALFWKWGWLGLSLKGLLPLVLFPALLFVFCLGQTVIESAVIGTIWVGLVAMGLPTCERIKAREAKKRELREQRAIESKVQDEQEIPALTCGDNKRMVRSDW